MDMKKICMLLFALACMTATAAAREISGIVLAESDSTQVIGATCSVMIDGQLTAQSATDDNGRFAMNLKNKAAATLNVSASGYGAAEVLLSADRGDIKDLVIYLPDANMLKDVTVAAKSIINSGKNTIVYPSTDDVKASHSTIDLFQKLPLVGLMADPINRALSVDGGSPMILIDDVPSSMEEVNALQPKDINRIEYSRLTPARYMDQGYKGLVKITLKKRNDGGNVSLWARGCPTTAFNDWQASGSYHQGPSQFRINYDGSWRNYQEVYDFVEESYVGDDFRVDMNSQDRNPFNYLSNRFNFSYDYRPNARTLFSAKLVTNLYSSHRRTDKTTEDTYYGTYDSHNDSRDKNVTPSLDLFFRRDFNDSNSLEVEMTGTLRRQKYRSSFAYYMNPETPEEYEYNIDNRRRSLITEAAYRHSFGEWAELSAGFQNTLSHSRNTYIDSDYRPVLTENNNYVYAGFEFMVGKVNVALSSGAKLYWIKNDDNSRNFVRNLSRVTATWNINSKWDLRAGFDYSPSIPSLTSLTDYTQQTSPYMLRNGNPDLKVAEYFTYDVTATYNHKIFSASLTATYATANNPRTDETTYLGDRMFLTRTVNYGVSDHLGGSLQFRLNNVGGFGANVRLDVDWYHTSGNTWNEYLTSFYAYGSLWWSKGPFTITYWNKLPCKYLKGSYVTKEENGNGLSLTYKPNKHWVITGSWMYMFESKGTKYPQSDLSRTSPYYNNRYIKDNGNMIVLSVSYTANFGSIFRSGKRSLRNSDNSSSIITY